jgi:CubicO group peptidase (beta-lactamase class C family)
MTNTNGELGNVLAEMSGQLNRWPRKNVVAMASIHGSLLPIANDQTLLSKPMVWASVTKLLASYALLIAHEEESIDIDAEMPEEYLRGYTFNGKIKLSHLMSHTSGLPFEGMEAVTNPGKRRIYSNGGFNLISSYFTDITEFPFIEYIKEALFAPLGMDSFFFMNQKSVAKDAVGSIEHMGLFLSELLSPTLIAEETLTWATQNWFPNLIGILPGFGRYEDNAWGLGFEVKSTKDPHWMPSKGSSKTFGHFGQSGSFLWVDPENNLGLISSCDVKFDTWAHELWPSFSNILYR